MQLAAGNSVWVFPAGAAVDKGRTLLIYDAVLPESTFVHSIGLSGDSEWVVDADAVVDQGLVADLKIVK